MAYQQPITRPSTPLNGQQIYPELGTILDIGSFRKTSVPAGSNGRIVAVGDTLYEANNLAKPVRFIGNNMGAILSQPLDPALADTVARKFRAEGLGVIRMHASENYLMVDGAPYGSAVARVGDCNISPTRWAEFCKYVEAFRSQGLYIIINPGSTNLALNMGNNANRYESIVNASGSITVTVVAGEITALTPNVASTGHFYPPAIIITPTAGSPGVGARYEAIINGAGTVTGYTKISGGAGYVSGQVTATYFGGTGQVKPLIHDHAYVQNNWLQYYTYVLTTPSTETGQTLLNDNVVMMCEGYNEVHMMAPLPTGGILANQYRTYFRPQWQKWLSDFCLGDIEALKAKCGLSADGTITAFSHATFDYRLEGAAGATLLDRVMMALSRSWMKYMDGKLYARMASQLRTLGYPGLIAMRDMGGDVTGIKDNAECGANIQQFHTYPGLQDSSTPGSVFTTGGQRNNGPSSYGDMGPIQCMNVLIKDVPRVWTEFGWPMPGQNRGEMGPLAAGLSCQYNFSAIIYHSSSAIALTYGPTNPAGLRGLSAHQWEMDFLQQPSVKAGAIVYLRGDVATLPVSKTMVMNNRALSIFSSLTEFTDPYFSSRQQFTPNDYALLVPIARIENTWDTQNTTANATAWQTGTTGIGETSSAFLQNATYGFNSNAYAAFRWFVTDGNNDQSPASDRPFSAMRYSKTGEFFIDRQSGVMGCNTPMSQVAATSKRFRNKMGSTIKQGARHVSNTSRKIKSEAGNGYILNCYGTRFWQNLEINHLDDGILLSVHAMDGQPIATSSSLLIILASNCYNKDATWQSVLNTGTGLPNKRISNQPVTQAGSGWTKAPYVTYNGTGNQAIGRCVLDGNGGVASVFMEEDGLNFGTTAPTPTLVGGVGGTGTVLGTPELMDDDPQREVCLLSQYSDTTNQGWPWGQKLHSAEFVLRGIDGTQPWTVHELMCSGARAPNGALPTTRLSDTAVQFNIDAAQTVYPAVYFHAVKGQIARKAR